MRHTGYASPKCPQDAAHGSLLAWPSSIAGWHCPSQAHTGYPFYRTDLSPVSRPAPTKPVADKDTAPRARSGRTEAPDPASPRNIPAADPPSGGGDRGVFWP